MFLLRLENIGAYATYYAYFAYFTYVTNCLLQALLARLAAGLQVLVLLHDTSWNLCFSAEALA